MANRAVGSWGRITHCSAKYRSRQRQVGSVFCLQRCKRRIRAYLGRISGQTIHSPISRRSRRSSSSWSTKLLRDLLFQRPVSDLAMSARPLQRYLDALGRHAGQTRVPGLDVSSQPLPLADIFVQRDMVPTLAAQPQRQEDPPVSAIEVLAKERALAVLGEPGQGKSTLL